MLLVVTLSACNKSNDESPRHCTCCSFVALPEVLTGDWCGISSVVLIAKDSNVLICDSSSLCWLSTSCFTTGERMVMALRLQTYDMELNYS